MGLFLFHGQFLLTGFHRYSTNNNLLSSEHGHSHGHSHSHGTPSPKSKPASITSATVDRGPSNVTSTPKIPIRVRSHSRSDSYASFSGHPVATRASLVQVAQEMALASSPPHARKDHGTLFLASDENFTVPTTAAADETSERTPLLGSASAQAYENSPSGESTPSNQHTGHGHNHSASGSMNMRAVLLHVLGDALGNVGVIATGLIIWLTSWSFKYYFDPVISLVITVIIFSSALPLGKIVSSLCLYTSLTIRQQSAVHRSFFFKGYHLPFQSKKSGLPFSRSMEFSHCMNFTSGNFPKRK